MVRYHGNWCGPNWSDGKVQQSVRGFAPAIDEFDETCRQHDFALADNPRNPAADHTFIKQNIRSGNPKRQAAAMLVAVRNAIEPAQNKNMNKNSKIQQPKQAATKPAPKPKQAAMKIERTMAPVSVGTLFKNKAATVTRSTSQATIVGTDFLATVEGQGVATFGLGKAAMLSPAYFASTVLGNLARSFESYRFNRLRIHYIPKVATSVTGQIILCSQKSVSEPGLQPEAGTFLNRAMSQGNAVFSSLWSPCAIDINCPKEWKLVDPTTTSDPDDAIWEELQVYTQISAAAQVGYLLAEYDISFKEPIYQPHSTSIPIATGPGVRITLADGASTAADDWITTEAAGTLGLAGLNNGTVFRGVFDLQGSAVATGATFANALYVNTSYRTNTTTLGVSLTNLPMIGGLTLYFVVVGSSLYAYTSLEAALAGAGSGQVFARTTVTVAGSYNFDMAIVHQGISNNATVQ